MMCDSTGFPYSFWLYEGIYSNNQPKSILLGDNRSAKLQELVLDFVGDVVHPNHTFIFDNYYSSLELGLALNSRSIRFLCTVRSDRPTELFSRISENIKKRGNIYGLLHKDQV